MKVEWDVLRVTSFCFAALFLVKAAFYLGVILRVRSILGAQRVKLFWKHYAHSKHLIAAAWRLGAFISLFVTYLALVFYQNSKTERTLLELQSPWCWAWLLALIVLLGRALLQIYGEWIDLEESLQSLRRTLQVKAGLRHVSRAVTLLAFAYPLVAIQGWVGVAVWSKRALLLGQGAQLFEKWFDRKVHGEFRQFVVAAITGALLETGLRLIVVVLGLVQSQYGGST